MKVPHVAPVLDLIRALYSWATEPMLGPGYLTNFLWNFGLLFDRVFGSQFMAHGTQSLVAWQKDTSIQNMQHHMCKAHLSNHSNVVVCAYVINE